MSELMTVGRALTMSSIDLLDLVNKKRARLQADVLHPQGCALGCWPVVQAPGGRA